MLHSVDKNPTGRKYDALSGGAMRLDATKNESVSRARKWSLGVTLGLVAVTALVATAAGPPNDWPMFGQDLTNSAASRTNAISAGNVNRLQPKWTFTTGGDVSARAAVVNNVAYFPDWGGNIWALHATNGNLKWSHQLSDYSLTGSFTGVFHSRTTPAVVDGTVYIGTQEGAWLLAISAANGDLLWKTQLESPANDPMALITASPAVSGGVVYTGVASNQEGAAAFVPGFVCCNARGSVVAVNASTGAIQWKTYTVPTGYSGGGVWGSNFVVDAAHGRVFVGTGNNYSHPTAPAYLACIAGGGTPASCAAPNNHVDSILALDMNTGAVIWAKKLVTWNQLYATDGSDDWNVDCFFFANSNCPSNPGPDYDFASAPNLITYQTSSGPKTILGAGQKSGIYYALDPDTGAELWQTQVGPGSSLGGMEWGSASDGERIYVQIANFYGIPYAAGSAGSWAALNPATGAILWQKADPNGSIALGPVAVANGVVYAPSMAGSATAPTMLALDAATGNTLWSFAAGSSVIAGATIVDSTVYWGSGYTHLGIPGYTGNNKFYAFRKNGQ
jgi:polyvinyl alcohol dehydrogenase (cytochrome)